AGAPPSPFQHYWSLGVEEQFYLLWPALIIGAAWLVRRTAGGAAAVVLAVTAAASFAVSLAWTDTWPSWAFFALPSRAWELAAGGLVALTVAAWRQSPRWSAAVAGWGGLALIVASWAQLDESTPYPGTAALLPVLGTALVIGAGCAAPLSGVGRLLSVPAVRAVGRLSYSWYLWHWPVLVLAPAVFGSALSLVGRLAMVVLSFGLAILTLHLIENPARYAPVLRAAARRSLALGGAVTAAAVCAGSVLLVLRPVPVGHGPAVASLTVTAHTPAASAPRAVPSLREQVQAAVAASANLHAVPSNLSPSLAEAPGAKPLVFVNGCVRSWRDTGQPECASAATTSSTTVSLFGDSHAAMWQPAFEPIARQREWRLETISKVTCPPMAL